MTATRSRPRRTQQERRAETRRRIVEAAGRVFAERGYHAATLDAVAERAGLSKGSIYYTFGSKHELFASLLRERIDQRLGEIRRALDDADGDAPLPAGPTAIFLDAVTNDRRWGPLFFEFVAQAARDPRVRPAFTAWLRETRAALTGLIAERMAPAKTSIAPERLAILVSAMANGMLLEIMFDADEVPRELLGEGVELLAGGASALSPAAGPRARRGARRSR